MQLEATQFTISDNNPHPPPIPPFIQPKEYKVLFGIQMFLVNWCSGYGPTDTWSHTLQVLHDEAVEEDGEEEWKEGLNDKVRQGLGALGEVKDLFLELPTGENWIVRDIFYQALELSMELQRGIAYIRAHLALYGD